MAAPIDAAPRSPRGPMSVLGLDADDLATCVSCGLCLPHCPTFRVTGEERFSPRGRIDAMRAVDAEALPVDGDFVEFMETCVQCRGCETACPSGVRFGSLMEQTRTTLAELGRVTPWWQRFGLSLLTHHRVLLAGSSLLAVVQRLGLVPRRLGLGRLPIRRGRPIERTGSDAWIFTGCVMDAWQRDTHRNTAALVTLTGAGFDVPGPGGACCGALHAHAGLHRTAAELAEQVIASMPGDAAVLVNSAGCGAALAEYGELLGTDAAHAFSARVRDASTWLAERIDRLPAATQPDRPTVIVQDPCHLRHVQRSHVPVRVLLSHVADVIELDDDGLCCGAGGAYSALQPDLSDRIRSRKLDAIDRAVDASGAVLVASANPGCTMHLQAGLAGRPGDGPLAVRHPIDIVADAIAPARARR